MDVETATAIAGADVTTIDATCVGEGPLSPLVRSSDCLNPAWVFYVPRALTRTRKTKTLLPRRCIGRRPGSARSDSYAPARRPTPNALP
jgi:hypothetical protein